MTLRSSATTSRTKLTRRPMIPGRSASLTLTPFCTGGPAFLPAPAVFGFVTVPVRPLPRARDRCSALSSSSSTRRFRLATSRPLPSNLRIVSRGSNAWPRLPRLPRRLRPALEWPARCGRPVREPVEPSAQGRQDSNLQPAVLETAALPIAPHPCARQPCLPRARRDRGQSPHGRQVYGLPPAFPNRAAGRDPYQGPRHAQHLLAVADRDELHLGVPLIGEALHHAAHHDLGASIVVGYHHWPGEPDTVVDHGRRVANPLRHRLTGQRHRVHAVCDHAGQADRAGSPVVPVDRVEVAGGAGVADQVGPGDPECPGRQPVADLHRKLHGQPSPRTTRTEPVTTGSPASVTSSVRVVRMSWPPREAMSSTTHTHWRRSPAYTGRVYRNRCSPWTTLASS